MIIFFGSLILSYLVMSVAEWYIHKHMMHHRFFPRKWFDDVFENHAILHHKHERTDLNIDLPVYYHLVLSSPLIILLFFLSIPTLLGWLCIIVYHSLLWTHAHRAIHGLEHNWLEKTEFYKQMKNHHELHHYQPNKNFGVVFFWVDRLMGTKI